MIGDYFFRNEFVGKDGGIVIYLFSFYSVQLLINFRCFFYVSRGNIGQFLYFLSVILSLDVRVNSFIGVVYLVFSFFQEVVKLVVISQN